MMLPCLRAQVHQRVEGLRAPSGTLGRFRAWLQDAEHSIHGIRDVGVQAAVRQGPRISGYRVLPYCPKDQTPLSAHELRMDADVYQDRQDTTVSVAVKLRDEEDAYAVFWTTTPWTVPTNFAIVVGADIDYVEVRPTEGKFAGKKFYLGKPLLAPTPRNSARTMRSCANSRVPKWKAGATTRCSRTSQATRRRRRQGSRSGRLPDLHRRLCRYR